MLSRKEHLKKNITFKAIEILDNGFIYVHGRDSKFSPIIVLVMKCYSKSKYVYYERAIIYLLEYLIKNCLYLDKLKPGI